MPENTNTQQFTEAIKVIKRIADALGAIAHTLARIATPPAPRVVPPSANQTYLSGQWKRRPGNTIYDTPMRNVRAAPNVQLDPYFRRDVPNVESGEGQLGIGE